MDKSYKLSEAEHEQIYRKLKIRMFEGTMPNTTPTLVIIAASQGQANLSLRKLAKKNFLRQEI